MIYFPTSVYHEPVAHSYFNKVVRRCFSKILISITGDPDVMCVNYMDKMG